MYGSDFYWSSWFNSFCISLSIQIPHFERISISTIIRPSTLAILCNDDEGIDGEVYAYLASIRLLKMIFGYLEYSRYPDIIHQRMQGFMLKKINGLKSLYKRKIKITQESLMTHAW